ncbi:Heat shock protein DnaJ domain protein [Hyella patelloides LEGE 07179]|uniref:Heat shock protein DnaJ domain protein n=1 Tax=Hyella patelloides LEGE 07179 TaxID=945734 RepID=A0A563VLZ2_9CYAN|nr:CPP1-like family protein [Hyella patelloides]VEP12377.1 Heat shock protein DnaJ domain protein [Hyella patelloides LEGE 07179]
MSEQNPYEQLGVTENSSFEEIQSAKKRICEENNNDAKVVESIEAAYDAVIMDRLRLRQEGKIKVPERIRFPERKVESPVESKPLVQSTPNWVQNLLDSPSQKEVLVPTGVFLTLAGITAFGQTATTSLLPLLMALGFMGSVYFINSKEKRFGRSLLITLVMLVAGVALGNALANSLVSSGAMTNSPDQITSIASVVTFVLFWLASCFLK